MTFWRELTKLELALAGAIVLGIAGLVAWDPSNAGLNLATEGLGVVASVLVLEQVLERRQRARDALLADQTTGAVLARVDQAVERFGRSVSAAIGLPWYVQHATREAETWHTRIADSAWTPGQATLPKRLPDWERRRREGDEQVASDLDQSPMPSEAFERHSRTQRFACRYSSRCPNASTTPSVSFSASSTRPSMQGCSGSTRTMCSAPVLQGMSSGEGVRDLALLIADYLDTRPRPPRRGSA